MIGMHFNDPEKGIVDTDWVRLWDCGVTWKDIHLEPGVYDWSRLDWLMNLYSDRNIIYVVAATPRWLAMDPDAPHFAPWLGPGTNSLPSDIDEFNKFIWHLTTRYKGRIKAYEIWNEPQLADFMYPYNKRNRRRLATMTKRAYRTIKSIDSNAFVLSASVLPRKSSGGMRRGNRFLKELKRKGWPVDRITCHIYPEVGAGPIEWAIYLTRVKQSARKFGGPRLIWVTETNYNLLGPVIDGCQAEQFIRFTYDLAGNSPIFWYGWNKMDVLGGLDLSPGSSAWQEMQKYKDVP